MRNSDRQYPPQSGPYAVKVKNGAGWRNYDVARLQISVGQAYHEGDKLAATLEWASQRFDRLIICVNDTLQRFNAMYEDDMTEEQAFAYSFAMGTAWIERNSGLLHSIPHLSLHCWEEWRNHADYKHTLQQARTLYAMNAEFRQAVDRNVIEFWQRRAPGVDLTSAYTFQHFKPYSTEYLLEETAVFSLMFEAQKAADIYPGTLLMPCQIFRGRDVEGVPRGLRIGTHNTRIDFKRQTPHLNTHVQQARPGRLRLSAN